MTKPLKILNNIKIEIKKLCEDKFIDYQEQKRIEDWVKLGFLDLNFYTVCFFLYAKINAIEIY